MPSAERRSRKMPRSETLQPFPRPGNKKTSAKPKQRASASARLETRVFSVEHARPNRRAVINLAEKKRLASHIGQANPIRNPSAWLDIDRTSTAEWVDRVRRPPQQFIKEWTGPGGSYIISEHMRAGTEMPRVSAAAAKAANDYFRGTPQRLVEDTVFWRGINGAQFADGYSDKSFVSVSRQPAVAAAYAGNIRSGVIPSVYKVGVPAGTPILPVSGPNARGIMQRPNNEVVLPPGSFTRTGPNHFNTTIQSVGTSFATALHLGRPGVATPVHYSMSYAQAASTGSPLSFQVNSVTPVIYTPSTNL